MPVFVSVLYEFKWYSPQQRGQHDLPGHDLEKKKKNIKNTRKNLTTCLEQHWIYPSEQNMSLQDQF